MEWRESKILTGVLVSDTGLVKNSKTSKILKQCLNKRNGYLYISYSLFKKVHTKRVHRLIALEFIDNPNAYTDVNHKDGDKTNNQVGNLEWCSRRQNIIHAIKNGLVKGKKLITLKPRPDKVIIRKDSKQVHQIDDSGNLVNSYPSIMSASYETEISACNINSVCHGRFKTAGGYKWSFAK